MAYIYSGVALLEGEKKVGSMQCVALIQHYAGAPRTVYWKAGAAVLSNLTVVPGTAIATFVDGKYPNRPTGNHAAFFLRHGSNGFWIMDQWASATKKTISSRFIRTIRKNKNGTWPRAGDNANAYAVIEDV